MKYRWFRLDFPGDLYVVVDDDDGNVCCVLRQQPIVRTCNLNGCHGTDEETNAAQQQNRKEQNVTDKFHSSTITVGETESERNGTEFS